MLAQSIEFAVFFEYKFTELHRAVKMKLKEGVPNEELVQFNFSIEETKKLTWTRKNEFKFNGAFYDVVRKQEVKGKTHFFCIRDDEEKKLFALYEAHFQFNLEDDLDGQNPMHTVFELFKKPLFLENKIVCFQLNLLASTKKEYFKLKLLKTQSYLDLLDKPPRSFA